MNNHHHSTNDFRFLDVTAPAHRFQIEHELLELGTDPEVIFWIFTQFDELKAEYTAQLRIAQKRIALNRTLIPQ